MLDEAVSAGAVSVEQAAVIGSALADVPAEVGPEVTAKAEPMLVGWADEFDPIVLGKLGARILTHVAPEVADRRDADMLSKQEARAHRKRSFKLTPTGDGLVRLTGWLGRVQGRDGERGPGPPASSAPRSGRGAHPGAAPGGRTRGRVRTGVANDRAAYPWR